jgi:hypothetical protein
MEIRLLRDHQCSKQRAKPFEIFIGILLGFGIGARCFTISGKAFPFLRLLPKGHVMNDGWDIFKIYRLIGRRTSIPIWWG